LQTFRKTRIAPTPSGYLHLGNILSFSITAALARKTGAKILLRIDDLDQDRVNERYVQDVFDVLSFLEIPWDEGPCDLSDYERNWSQMHRKDSYKSALLQLKESGSVFACNCSRTQQHACTCRDQSISLDAENVNWRLHTNKESEISIQTLNDGTIKTTLPAEMKDFVVKKKDGYPAYQLTSVIDDLHYGIDLVVRGDDLWPSTVAQHYLADILNQDDFKNITFCHHALIIGGDGKKLSKSAGATSIKYLREQGKTAADIYGEIGRMVGLTEDLRSFETLASLI
jgi:glutamyl/glutaminyl-tRNA synthetase